MHNLSIWERETWYAPQDILIVGAGLMGLWSALELKKRKPSLRITIIERHTTPLGASTRNAGFACFGSPTELIQNAASMGTDAMLQIAEMRHKGIEKIKTHFTDTAIGWEACGGFECINHDYKGWNTINDKLSWLNGLLKPITGNDHCFKRSDKKLSQQGLKGFDALIENTAEASLHSGMLVQSLTKKVQAAGVTILYGIEIQYWEKAHHHIHVITGQKIKFSATQLLFCTNAFTHLLLPELKITAGRGQVIVTSPIDGLAMKGTFHFEQGFYYWRNLGNRILLGGGRNKAFEEETTLDLTGSDTIKDILILFLKEHLNPSYTYQIEHHWSGVMGFTEDGKPFVGRLSDSIFAAIACNGMGLALTPMIAEDTANLLLSHF